MNEYLKSLEAQEQELERLRLLVSPERWPRIYEMLRRVREEIRREQSEQNPRNRAA